MLQWQQSDVRPDFTFLDYRVQLLMKDLQMFPNQLLDTDNVRPYIDVISTVEHGVKPVHVLSICLSNNTEYKYSFGG